MLWFVLFAGCSLLDLQRDARVDVTVLQGSMLRQRVVLRLARERRLPSSLADVTSDGMTPLDGWDRPFVLRVERQQAFIVSFGEDGAPGGDGIAADIVSEPITLPPQ